MVLALSDARVKGWYPPSAFNCPGHAESLTESEARAIGISPIRIVDAEDESTFTGPGYGDEPNLRGMLRGLDPTLSARVRKAIAEFDPAAVED